MFIDRAFRYLWRFYLFVYLGRYMVTLVGPAAVLLVAIIAAGWFDDYGLPRLFWHVRWPAQAAAGLAAWTMMFITISFGYLHEMKRIEALVAAGANPAWCWYGSGALQGRRTQLYWQYLWSMLACWALTGLIAVAAVAVVRFAGQTRNLGFMIAAMGVPLLVLWLLTVALRRKVGSGGLGTGIVALMRRNPGLSRVAYIVLGIAGLVLMILGQLVVGFMLAGAAYALRWASRPGGAAGATGYLLSAVVIGVCGVLLAVMGRVPPMPAVAVCTLLSVAAAVHTCVLILGRKSWTVVTAIALVLVFMAGNERYKVRLPALAPYYSMPAAAAPAGGDRETPVAALGPDGGRAAGGAPAGGGGLLKSVDLDWDKWSPAGKRPLVLVCASGGGISAAVWTCTVLNEVCGQPGMSAFPYHIRMVTGASGGMVGASMFVSTLQAPSLGPQGELVPASPLHGLAPSRAGGVVTPLGGDAMVRMLAEDCLGDVVQTMVFNDIPRWMCFGPLEDDRGQALERAWARTLQGAFEQKFSSLRQGEREGWRPSLVYSPVMLEDSRRLLISNLDLAGVAKSTLTDSTGTTRDNYADCEEMFKRFPLCEETLRVATAARINAAFPFVSPTPVIPLGGERRRLADAGYFDNFGVDLACRWLSENEDWVSEHVSRVLILQIRTFRPEEFSGDRSTSLSRAAEDVTGPPTGAFQARTSMMRSKNDRQVQDVIAQYRRPGLPPVTTEIVECPRDRIPLTWRLTDAERNGITGAVKDLSVQATLASVRNWFRGEQAAIDAWDNDPACQSILKDRTLRVAVSDEVQMGWFVYLNNGQYAGFDISLAELIAERLGPRLGLPPDQKLRVHVAGPYAWERLLATPRDHDVDLVITSISYKPDREKQYGLRFSVPYHMTEQAIVIPAGADPALLDPTKWTGRIRIGVQGSTTSDAIARQLAVKLMHENPNLEVSVEPKKDFQAALLCFGETVRDGDRIEVILTDNSYTETLNPGGDRAIQCGLLKVGGLAMSLPTYLRNDYYSIAVAEDCPRLLWEVNSILMELSGAATRGTDNQLHLLANKAKADRGIPTNEKATAGSR